MERNERKNPKSSIIFISSLIVCLVIFILLFLKCNEQVKKKSILHNKLYELNSTLNIIIDEESQVDKQINFFKNITDEINNIKSEVSKLTINLEQAIINKKTNYKIAYLTFDDGPYYSTNEFLRVLKEKRVKATFFTIGRGKETCFDNRNADCTSMYKKIYDSGHTIANHTYSHLIFYGLYNSTSSFMNEVKKQENLIQQKTGYKTNIVRFPGGSSSSGNLKNSIISELRNNGYGWVDWSAQDGDGGSLDSADTAWRNLKNSINDNIEVVLFHDYNNITLSVLPDFIDYLEEQNYIILPLVYESVKVNK